MSTRMLVVGGRCNASRLGGLAVLTCVLLSTGRAPGAEALTGMDKFMIKRGYAVVPLTRGPENHLLATAKINGKSALCMVDTGASDLIVDSRRSGGLKPLGRTATPAYGLFGEYASDLPTVWVETFEAGGVVFSNQQALVSSLHRDARAKIGSYIPTSREEKDAIIGMSLLRNMHAWVDCYAPRLYVRLEKPDAAVQAGMEQSFRASGFNVAPAKALGTKLFAVVLINGQNAMFEVDTGTYDTMFALDQLDAFHLSNREHLGQSIDLGGKRKDVNYTRPESFKFGEFELKRFPIGTEDLSLLTRYNDELKKRDLPPVVGLLGPDVLDRSRAFIDCDGGRIFLMPEKTGH